jgi:hypothetical protein
MNKHSATKKRSVKPSRKAAVRKPARRHAAVRRMARQPEANGASSVIQVTAAVSVSQITAITSPLRSHKFSVGQTVFYTSSPISRPGASGSYKVVRLLPSDGDDYQYRIKNPGEAFERVAKESQLELEN